MPPVLGVTAAVADVTWVGAGAGKDLTAAEAAYKTAKAEYDFQSNISLSREVNQARSETEIARVEVSHLRNELRALGAVIPEGEANIDTPPAKAGGILAVANGIVK